MIHAYAAKTAGGMPESFEYDPGVLKDKEPIIETFEFSQVNEAMAHLAAGKARYRIVLKH